MPSPEAPETARGADAASVERTADELRVLVGRLRRRLREEIDTRELTPSQTSILHRIDRDGAATASDLAAAERVRPQSAAATIGVLEERGFVTRHQDPADGRRLLVTLTDAGRAFLDDKQRAGQEWLTRALSERLTDAERATVARALTILGRLVDR
jgi:DNA-binding MarR family transcriptional regulator